MNEKQQDEKHSKAIVRTFSLYQPDCEDIAQYSRNTGIHNESAALRAILQEWRNLKAQLSCCSN